MLEEAVAWFAGPSGGSVEATVVNAVEWLRLGIELTGALVIALGVLGAVATFGVSLAWGSMAGFTAERLKLARYLALALEFQLGADILSTAIAPSWDQIGKLGAIAVIRTALNFFLTQELREFAPDLPHPSSPPPNTPSRVAPSTLQAPR